MMPSGRRRGKLPGTTGKRIVCLANSRKQGGRCVAGIELTGQNPASWIRPVSGQGSEGLMEREQRLEDGSGVRLLDVVEVPLLRHQPRPPQTENWLVDPQRQWRRVGRLQPADLDELADADGSLWQNGHSTSSGLNDQVPVEVATQLDRSLKLINVPTIDLQVWAPGQNFGNPRRRVQARFHHGGAEYWLWVTDPEYEAVYLARPDGNYSLEECFLTISIGEPYKDGFCYKLVAAIIERDREEGR